MAMIGRVLREPLLYFLGAGALLFWLTGASSGASDSHDIVVTAAERQRLQDQWTAQVGRAPSTAELARLVDDWTREEIYYREALALGLDDGDVIIRRRLVQKLEFLTQDMAATAEPTLAELTGHYEIHADRYREPERFSFVHRYFSSQRPDAETAAHAAAADDGAEGDPFILQRTYAARSEAEIAELFGKEFAAAITALPTGVWSGPVRSAYGWHAVRVDTRIPARLPPLEEIRERVGRDLQQARRDAANAAFYAALRARYRIVES